MSAMSADEAGGHGDHREHQEQNEDSLHPHPTRGAGCGIILRRHVLAPALDDPYDELIVF